MPAQYALRAPDGASVTLERYPIVVGRLTPGGPVPDVDLSHLDPNEAVDSHHCELNLEDGGVEVHDLGGISGTWVEGRRLPPGARALLPVGGSLRVAGVSLSLITAPQRRPAEPPPPPPGSGFGGWGGQEGSRQAPPPPSAFPALPAVGESPPAGDLSAAPPLARRELERGARSVRMEPGLQLRVLHQHGWEAAGEPLSEDAVGEAVRAARRVLGLPGEAASGGGVAGDVSLDFVTPPLCGRPYLQVRAEVWLAPAQPVLSRAAAVAAAGGTVLLSTRWPRRLAVALAPQLDDSARRPRALDWSDPEAAGPDGWPRLRTGAEGCMVAALEGDPLLLIDPPNAELAAVLAALPRPGGGTVLALRSASAAAALSRLAVALSAAGPDLEAVELGQGMDRLAARVDVVLSDGPGGWGLGRPRRDGGSWALDALPPGGDF